MSKNLITLPLGLVFALAILLVPAADVSAQSQIPIEDDDIVATVTMDEIVFVVPHVLQPALEQYTGQSAEVLPMWALLSQLPTATATNSVQFEGGYPASGPALDLVLLGYGTALSLVPVVEGAGIASMYLD